MANIDPLKPHTEKYFFTDEEYGMIYDTIKKTIDIGIAEANDPWLHFRKNTNNGFLVIFFSERRNGPLPGLPKQVEDKIRKKFEEKTGGPVDHIGVLWARYTPLSGEIPSLYPHQDRSETHTAYMFTIELDKTLDWDFYVEDEKFQMEKNQAVWFSGTNQAHWRPDKYFGDEDYYDILLCQTHHGEDENPLSEEHYLDGDDHATEVAQKYAHLLPETLLKATRLQGPCQ